MRRWLKVALLATGTVLGYGFALHAMQHRRPCGFDRHGPGCFGCCDRGRGGEVTPKTEAPGDLEAPARR